MKTIRVVAAVILDSAEKPSQIFATARGYGEYKGGWEFPGGKIEQNESPEDAIVREIKEELDTEIIPLEMFHTVFWLYALFPITWVIATVCNVIAILITLPKDLRKLDDSIKREPQILQEQ